MPWRKAWDKFEQAKIGLIASPTFQRWATRFPLTRPIARRNAATLFDIGAGFVYSQILFACVQLGLFELLHAGPLLESDAAHLLGLSPEAAARLLRAAIALNLIAPAGGGRIRLATLGAAVLGQPGVGAMIRHHALLYADLADPVALLRHQSTAINPATPPSLAGYWPYAGGADPTALTPDQVAAYSALMAASNGMVAEQILLAYDIRRHHILLDVGGGQGTFLRAAAAASPDLQLVLFDLPAVTERANAELAEAGLSHRARTHAGNFFTDPLPSGADLITLVRIVHDHNDAEALALLRNVRRAMAAGGTVLLAEPMAGRSGAPRVADAYFGFYLLAMGSGQARTPQALRAMLRQAGFTKTRVLATASPLLTGLIVAQ
jgi:demethylspheroidene O-methyltransferase